MFLRSVERAPFQHAKERVESLVQNIICCVKVLGKYLCEKDMLQITLCEKLVLMLRTTFGLRRCTLGY